MESGGEGKMLLSLLTTIIIAVVSVIVAVIITLFVQGARYNRMRIELESLKSLRSENADLQQRLQKQNVISARLEEQLRASAEKIEWTTLAEKKLREAFEALSSQALKSNASDLQKRHAEMLDAFKKRLESDWQSQHSSFKGIVEPISKELQDLDKQVQELEKSRHGAYRGLMEQITTLTKHNRELQDATNTLSNALKSSTARGKWGEVQLRRIVEMSGMIDHVDFEEQPTVEGQRPDMVVHLPNKGLIPVDAKVPMQAYLEAQQAESEEKKKEKLTLHAKALKTHVTQLAKKEYWTQFDPAPDFVVMLIPYESGLVSAFLTDPGLMDEALENNVLIASPVTLLALLRTVSMGWLQLELAQNAQSIATHGKEVVNRFSKFFSYLSGVGTKLNGAVESFNGAMGSAESRLMPSLRKLSQMTAATDGIEPPPAIDSRARHLLASGTDDLRGAGDPKADIIKQN